MPEQGKCVQYRPRHRTPEQKRHHGASGAPTDLVPVYMLQCLSSLSSHMRVLPTRRQILEIQ